MLRNVIGLRLAEPDPAQRAADAAAIAARLRALAATVPGIRSLEVGLDELGRPGAWHLVAIIDYDDAEGLASVVAHPDHAAFIAEMQHLWADRMVVDFTV